MNIKEERIKLAAELISKAKHAVVFTGAGVSAESGIPTFRGENGLWKRYNPEEVASIEGFRKNPRAFWEFARELLIKRSAKPNPAHYAIAELEKMGIVKAVITQNVDMLHQRAGSTRVLELHGSMEYVDCLDCGTTYTWSDLIKTVEKGETPICKNCNSKYLKPRVVFFGEPLPQETLTEAMEESRQADVFIVVGSSLVVYPAARLPYLAKSSGAKMIIVNIEPTLDDGMFDVVIYGKAGEILPKIVDEVKKLRS